MLLSNHSDCVKVDPTERRFFVKRLKKLPKESDYQDFITWRDEEGGAESILYYLLNLDLSDFNPKAAAPITEDREQMVSDGLPAFQLWFKDYIENDDMPDIINATDTVNAYSDEIQQKAPSAKLVRTSLGTLGVKFCDKIVKTQRKATRLLAIRNIEKWKNASSAEWREEYEKGSLI